MKKILYVLLGLIILYMILAFAGPKQVKIEREISIQKPAALIKEKLGNYHFFHDEWSPWTAKDPAMVNTYSGTPGEAGHYYAWKGNDQVGEGTMTYEGSNGDSLLETFTFGGHGGNRGYYLLAEQNGSTNVKWGMLMDIGFLHRPPMLFMNMDKMMGPDFEKGLSNLKAKLEGMPGEKAVQYKITEQEWPEVTYVGKKETVFFQNLGAFFGTNFPLVFADLGKNKINPESAPSAIFTEYDEEKAKADVIAGVKVPNGTKLKGWDNFKYGPGKVLHVAYYGAYEKSAIAHVQMGNYIKANKLNKQEAVIEEYVTDPGSEKDTSKWLTNIYYLLK